MCKYYHTVSLVTDICLSNTAKNYLQKDERWEDVSWADRFDSPCVSYYKAG